MRRQNRFKKLKMPSFFKSSLREIIFKKIINLAIVAIFLLIAFVLVKTFLYRSNYFRLRSIETRSAFLDTKMASSINSQLLNTYKGRNIFKINLKNISQSLETSYPDAKEVVAKIALPDKLVISMKFRKPIAALRNFKTLYPIDEDGVVIASVDISIKELPIIEGAGLGDKGRNLKLALELLKEIKRSRLTTEYGIDIINARDIKNLSFYLKNGIEIRVGSENFKERLEVLRHTLKDTRLVMDRIKYIDVRFSDIAIGPK